MSILVAEQEDLEFELAEPDTGVQPRLWTLEEFARLDELGLLEGRRVELVHGELIEMTSMAVPHVAAVMKTQEALETLVQRRFWIRNQLPLVSIDRTQLLPDFTLVNRDDLALLQLPETAVLVIEISDSTINYDRRVKAPIYAAANVPEYWILNLKHRELEVRRDPVTDSRSRTGHSYSTIRTFRENDSVSPLFDTNSTLKVADLLP